MGDDTTATASSSEEQQPSSFALRDGVRMAHQYLDRTTAALKVRKHNSGALTSDKKRVPWPI